MEMGVAVSLCSNHLLASLAAKPLHPPQRSSLATPAARHLDESKKQNNELFAIVEDEEEQRERRSASLPCLTMGTTSISSRKRGWLDQLTGLWCKKGRIQTREKVWRERRVRGRKRAEKRSRRWAGIFKLCFYNPDPSCFENFSTALGQ